MAAAIAETTRGGIRESVHYGGVVAVDAAGEVVAAAGDPEEVIFFRSSAKPFQAIPVIESGAADAFGLTPAELALCCASHHATPEHQRQVAAMLAKLGLAANDLQCGCPLTIDSEEAARIVLGQVARSPLQCDCSGKHAGMLATIVHEGLSQDDYLEPSHPLQQRILGIMSEVMRVPRDAIVLGTDGCSLPTFGAPLRAFATAYAALAAPERVPAGAGREHAAALGRLRAAMTAYPVNVSGHGSLVADLMSLSDGRVVAKSGAEGLLCLAVPERELGIAIRVSDGSFRAHPAIVAATFAQLGILDAAFREAILARHSPQLRNHNGRLVGEIRPVFQLAGVPAAACLRPVWAMPASPAVAQRPSKGNDTVALAGHRATQASPLHCGCGGDIRMERIRTGVIGVGAIAQMMHLPYLRQLDDRFEIAALCDVDTVALEAMGRHYGVTRLFTDANDLLAEPLDAVFVLTSGDHAPVTLAALARGLHVLVEKPLAYTLAETDEVIAAAERAGTTVMVAMMKQYDPGYQRGVELVKAMRDLRYVSATTLEADGTAYMSHHAIVRGGSPAKHEKSFGAAMFNAVQESILAREPIDLLREATGSDDPAVLTAYVLLISSSIHDINVLRGALGQPSAVLSANLWAGGTSFTATLAYDQDVRTNYTWTLIPYLKDYSQTFAFHGSEEFVRITFPSPYLQNAPTHVDVAHMEGTELAETRLTVSYEEAFKRELLEFAECVQTGRPPRTTAAGFRQDLEVLTAIARTFTPPISPA